MNSLYIAKHQLVLIARSKWLLSFGFIFSILAVFITLFGQGDQSGYDGFNRVTASLLNLNLLLIPLISLLLGSLFLAGEKEDHFLMLLLTYPISTQSVIIGKFLGFVLSVWAVLTFGYGAAFLVLFFNGSTAPVGGLITFYVFSLLLAVMFLSISLLVGMLSKTRFQALSASLIIWSISVLFYEFIVMGTTLFLEKAFILPVLTIFTFLNPVELIRVWSVLQLDGAAVFGPSIYEFTVWADGSVGKLLLVFATILWTATPIAIVFHFLKRGVANE